MSWNTQNGKLPLIPDEVFNFSSQLLKKICPRRRAKTGKNYRKRNLNFPYTERFCSELYSKKHKPEVKNITQDEYEKKKIEFIDTLRKTKEEFDKLERDTRGQANNALWLAERQKRLTSFKFGKICKMRKTTSGLATLKDLLYSDFYGNSATEYGKRNESKAVREFTRITNLDVSPCGLYINVDDFYLGASPDGVIGHDALIEVKCPYSALNMSPLKAIQENKIKCCQIHDNKIVLKRNHDFFYQVQGQLHITGRKYCYFTVWTPYGLEFEKIERDDQFWVTKMKPKLEEFYFMCFLPEIIDPKVPLYKPIRERPSYEIKSDEYKNKQHYNIMT